MELSECQAWALPMHIMLYIKPVHLTNLAQYCLLWLAVTFSNQGLSHHLLLENLQLETQEIDPETFCRFCYMSSTSSQRFRPAFTTTNSLTGLSGICLLYRAQICFSPSVWTQIEGDHEVMPIMGIVNTCTAVYLILTQVFTEISRVTDWVHTVRICAHICRFRQQDAKYCNKMQSTVKTKTCKL